MRMRARENPFRTEMLSLIRYRFVDSDWAGFLDRLRSVGYRGAIVGPKGFGKTSLLKDLAPRLEELGFGVRNLRLDVNTPRFQPAFLRRTFASLGSRDIVLLDGAEQASPRSWRSFLKGTGRAGGLVVTSHREGLLPTLIECRTSVELLDGILDELLGDKAEKVRDSGRRLFEKHAGNIRLVLRDLYDLYAGR